MCYQERIALFRSYNANQSKFFSCTAIAITPKDFVLPLHCLLESFSEQRSLFIYLKREGVWKKTSISVVDADYYREWWSDLFAGESVRPDFAVAYVHGSDSSVGKFKTSVSQCFKNPREWKVSFEDKISYIDVAQENHSRTAFLKSYDFSIDLNPIFYFDLTDQNILSYTRAKEESLVQNESLSGAAAIVNEKIMGFYKGSAGERHYHINFDKYDYDDFLSLEKAY